MGYQAVPYLPCSRVRQQRGAARAPPRRGRGGSDGAATCRTRAAACGNRRSRARDAWYSRTNPEPGPGRRGSTRASHMFCLLRGRTTMPPPPPFCGDARELARTTCANECCPAVRRSKRRAPTRTLAHKCCMCSWARVSRRMRTRPRVSAQSQKAYERNEQFSARGHTTSPSRSAVGITRR